MYEIDPPEVLDYKEAVLMRLGATPRCRREVVLTTLDGPWPTALAAAGHDASAPTCWVVEGVLFYLSAAAVAGLLAGCAVRAGQRPAG